MNDSMKVKVASAVTALFIGGIAAAGALTRSDSEPVSTASSKPQVIHRKKVKTVRAPSAPATVPSASYVSAPASAPTPVSTRVSPTAGGDDDEGGYDDEDGYEDGEGGESE